jgi:HEAT repeat protein
MMRLSPFAALLLLVAPARSVRAADESPEALVTALGGDNAQTRSDAYRVLVAKRPPEALPLLAKQLPNDGIEAQDFGVAIVAGYPAALTRPVYERWVALGVPLLKAVAGAALVRAGDMKGMEAVVSVFERRDMDPSLFALCLSHVGTLRDAALSRALRPFVVADAPATVLGPVLSHLAVENDGEARVLARRLLAAPSAVAKAMGAAYLLRVGEESVGGVLADALASSEFSYAAFLALHPMLADAKRLPAPVVDALLAIVETAREGWYLPFVINLLGDPTYTKAVPTLRALLDKEERVVANAAFEALSKIPGGMTVESVQALLTGGDETRRIAAAEALRRADDLSGLSALIDVLKNGKTARADAARALAGFRVRGAVEPLLDALADPDAVVRANADSSLQTLLTALFPYRRVDLASTGYVPSATPAANADAIKKIRGWYQASKDADW